MEAAAFILIDSSSDSSDDDFNIRGPMELRPRIEGYVEEVVDAYTDEEFRENFRMHRATFNHVLELIEDRITSEILDRGRHTLGGKIQLLLALWYFATPDSYRSVCGRFNIGKATAIRTVRRVCNALMAISPNIIVWPSGEVLDEVKIGFARMGFLNTIGCLDGMHVPIPKPKDHGQSYINRKKFPSIILQGVCDHTLKFTHCYAGEVGSRHDSAVFRKSEVWGYMSDNDKFPNDTHLLGDKAYPCIPQLMTPFKDNGHLTAAQKNYNFLLSRTRISIERAFGLLQKRFRCLKDLLDVRCLEWASQYVIACCVLHNICIMQNDLLEIDPIDLEDNNKEVIAGMDIARERLLAGQEKRNQLCQQINALNV